MRLILSLLVRYDQPLTRYIHAIVVIKCDAAYCLFYHGLSSSQ